MNEFNGFNYHDKSVGKETKVLTDGNGHDNNGKDC